MSEFRKPDIQVRIKGSPTLIGITTGNYQTSKNGREFVEVNMFKEGLNLYPPNQLETVLRETNPLEELNQGRFADPDILRTILISCSIKWKIIRFHLFYGDNKY